MKKLEKLTLKEMSNEMTLISPNELPMLIGGSGFDFGYDDLLDAMDAVYEFGNNAVQNVYEAVGAVTDAIGEAANAVADGATKFYNEHEEGIIVTANIVLDLGVAYLTKGAKMNPLDGLTPGQFGPGPGSDINNR